MQSTNSLGYTLRCRLLSYWATHVDVAENNIEYMVIAVDLSAYIKLHVKMLSLLTNFMPEP